MIYELKFNMNQSKVNEMPLDIYIHVLFLSHATDLCNSILQHNLTHDYQSITSIKKNFLQV